MLWEDTIDLRDGRRIHVRVVQPSDRATFEEGWEHLSRESRLFRFLGPRRELSDEELRYLTDFDGVDHLAIGAVTRDQDLVEHAVSVARFVRIENSPRCADFAITVVDAWQGLGIGRLMFERLIEAAQKRGIATFRADVLQENEGAKRLIRSVVPASRSFVVGSVVRFHIPIAPDASEDDCAGASHTPLQI